jgi:hypothetical protein
MPPPAPQAEEDEEEEQAEEEDGLEYDNEGIQDIQWSTLSTEDKEAFFSWLDEFFERFYGIRVDVS